MFINYEHENHIYSVSVERRREQFFVTYDNNEYTINAHEIKPGQLQIQLGDRMIKCVITEGEESKFVFVDGDVYQVKRIELTGRKKTTEKKPGDLNSPISGKVVSVKVKEGQLVKKNTVIMVIEAMKMEYLIRAPYQGIVKKIYFKDNDQVEIGETTAEFEKKKVK
jgi:3-methylcrotonyl-CoA carboxylase alpha subunit